MDFHCERVDLFCVLCRHTDWKLSFFLSISYLVSQLYITGGLNQSNCFSIFTARENIYGASTYMADMLQEELEHPFIKLYILVLKIYSVNTFSWIYVFTIFNGPVYLVQSWTSHLENDKKLAKRCPKRCPK